MPPISILEKIFSCLQTDDAGCLSFDFKKSARQMRSEQTGQEVAIGAWQAFSRGSSSLSIWPYPAANKTQGERRRPGPAAGAGQPAARAQQVHGTLVIRMARNLRTCWRSARGCIYQSCMAEFMMLRVQETALADLQQGRDNLQRELNERTGQLKALVKENFDHFISCKTTIDDIHKRLREAEKGQNGGDAGYVSTNDVIDTVSEVSAHPSLDTSPSRASSSLWPALLMQAPMLCRMEHGRPKEYQPCKNGKLLLAGPIACHYVCLQTSLAIAVHMPTM